MYEYRKMTPRQRAAVLEERRLLGRPWHAPPHFDQAQGMYLISAACYEHNPVMGTESRRREWENSVVDGVGKLDGARMDGWVVLPNHYHMLVVCDLRAVGKWLGRLHNGKATQWNREDGKPGRKVWHGFSDRAIRSERHYHATLNYVHGNPVKHGYVVSADQWPESSLMQYMEQFGRDCLADWWARYPVKDYGKGWDD